MLPTAPPMVSDTDSGLMAEVHLVESRITELGSVRRSYFWIKSWKMISWKKYPLNIPSGHSSSSSLDFIYPSIDSIYMSSASGHNNPAYGTMIILLLPEDHVSL